MIPKFILICLVTIFIIFNITFTIKKDYINPNEQLFFMNPVVLKMMTNIYSVIYADKFWLLSSQVDDETRVKTEESLKKKKAGFNIINYMDPNFTQPIAYVISGMIVNQKKYEDGMDILNTAVERSPTNTKLLFLKLMYITTYNPNTIDMEEVMSLSEKLYKANVINMGAMRISDFIAELVEAKTQTKEGKLKNLKHLLSITDNKEIEDDINEVLKKYKEEDKTNAK